ncbi:EamA family transporter [bacterium]|nr:EamA family transporter [bacterium]
MSQKLKTVLLLIIAMAATTLGDILMSKLMRSSPEIKDFLAPDELKLLAVYMLTSKIFWLAIISGIIFLSLWLYVLSYEDLSFAMPMTAMTYIFNAFLAGPILNEKMTAARWIGTVVIGAGVIIVSFSQGKEKEKEKAQKALDEAPTQNPA